MNMASFCSLILYIRALIWSRLCKTTTTVSKEEYKVPINSKNQLFVVEKSIFRDACILFKLSFQIASTTMAEVCIKTTSVIFIGHLPNAIQILSASSLVNTYTNVATMSIPVGSATALYSLIPQIVGSNKIHLMAVSVQRSFYVCLIINLPLFLVLLYCKQILTFIGVNSNNDIHWDYICNLCYAFFPYSYLCWILSILQNVSKNVRLSNKLTVISIICLIISVPLNYIFMYTLNYGYIGAALVINSTLLLNIILCILLLINNGYSFLFKPLPLHKIFEMNGIKQYLRFALPGSIQNFLTYIMKDSVVILTTFLNNSAIAVSCTAVMWQLNKFKRIHGSFGEAASIRIGKYIGANYIIYAKRILKIQIIFELFLLLACCFIFMLFRYQIPQWITNNSEVSSLISNKYIYVLLLNQCNRGVQRSISPIYRSLGYVQANIMIEFITRYLISLPLTVCLLFSSKFNYRTDMEIGVYIIWSVDTFGYFLQNVFLIFGMIYCIDWNKVLQESQLRINVDNNSNHFNKEIEGTKTKPNVAVMLSRVL